jgi:hypothetical protein
MSWSPQSEYSARGQDANVAPRPMLDSADPVRRVAQPTHRSLFSRVPRPSSAWAGVFVGYILAVGFKHTEPSPRDIQSRALCD